MSGDPVVDFMKAHRIPVTREAYIRLAHGRLVPDEEWTAEHEADLPQELQQT